jgi:hypothetical protein
MLGTHFNVKYGEDGMGEHWSITVSGSSTISLIAGSNIKKFIFLF